MKAGSRRLAAATTGNEYGFDSRILCKQRPRSINFKSAAFGNGRHIAGTVQNANDYNLRIVRPIINCIFPVENNAHSVPYVWPRWPNEWKMQQGMAFGRQAGNKPIRDFD